MKYLRSIIILFLVISSIAFSKTDKLERLSNVQAALVIDSLENQLEIVYPNERDDIIYQLAYYYFQIDPEQSEKNANEFLASSDSKTSPKQLFNIYNWLATINENKGNHASTYHYLELQKELLESVKNENNVMLKAEHLNSIIAEDETPKIMGLRYLSFFIIIAFIIIVSGLFIYIKILRKRHTVIESRNNQELEAANAKLQKFNDDLQQAIMEKTYERAIELEQSSNEIVELRKTLRKAEEANYLKNAFLGTMSHQIRTPLSGIMGFSNILETELALKGNEDLYEFAKNIQEAGEKLMSLITNIIDISSIEANILELKMTPCNVTDIFATLENDFTIKAKDKGLIFKTKVEPDTPIVYADNVNLIKSITIVIENAIQYSKKGFVTLNAKHKSDLNTIEIEIKDKGTGIDDETLKMLNDSFDYTKHGSSLTYQGHGLGLILAHRLITLMNGTLQIKSKPEKGTEILITLQCSLDSISNKISEKKEDIKPEVKPQEASIVSAPVFGKINIFVVEDDRMNRMVIEKMLKNAGKITTAVDGDDALKKLAAVDKKNQHFDVFLMDMNLPSPWDGMKLMIEMRKKYQWTNNTPFIAQTAYAMAGDKDLYLDAGFNDYISKPINKNELLTMVQKQLELFKKND